MIKFQKLISVTVPALLIFAVALQAQVVVEKSKDKVVISGIPYYVHIVKKGETVYSISKAYGITPQDLTKENSSAGNGVRVDQSLRIPVIENIPKPKTTIPASSISRDESKFIYHKLSPGETVFALSKKYGVSEDEIVQSNTGIEINRMPVGFEIAIPRRQFMNNDQKLQAPEKNIFEHKVEKGETLYSIAGKYGLTIRELRRENKGLMFPKVDDFIRIPIEKIAEAVISVEPKNDSVTIVKEQPFIQPDMPISITPVNDLNGTFNVALLLPLYFEENAIRTQIDSSKTVKGKPVYRTITRPEEWIYPESLGFLELYEGVLLASDTLRSLGLNINLQVYDIKSDTLVVKKLLESAVLKNMDLIIGPVYSHNLAMVAAYAKEFEIPVVSPVSLINNSPLDNNPYLFMANPSLEVAQETIAKRLGNYWDNNFILIRADSARLNPDVDSFKNKIFRELTTKIPYEEIKFKEFIFYSRSTFEGDSINRLGHALSEQAKNLVIIASEDGPVISESIADLHTLSRKFDIRVMGYPAIRGLDNEDWKDYFDLGIELYTPYWIDYNMRDVKCFNSSFRQKFLTEPSENSFAWEGYDIMYYFLSGLALNGKKFISSPETHNPDLLQTSFQFRRKWEGSGFENQKLYLIKFANTMDIKLLDENNVTIIESIK
jgi:LysM repeat protein/ABC-type branched-subunit amino acid transport system substrate-binding protein